LKPAGEGDRLIFVQAAGIRGNVLCITLSPDGKRVAAGCVDQTVRVWKAKE
jgi:WD40 repeat protein